MTIAEAMLVAWCIDRHWDDEISHELFDTLVAVIDHGETLYPEMTDQLVW